MEMFLSLCVLQGITKKMAVCALCAFFNKSEMNLEVVVDTQVPGQHLLHPLESSSDKRCNSL